MTEDQVKKILEKNGLLWSDFMEWIIGHTTSRDEYDNTIYWTHDVGAFINFKQSGILPVDFD